MKLGQEFLFSAVPICFWQYRNKVGQHRFNVYFATVVGYFCTHTASASLHAVQILTSRGRPKTRTTSANYRCHLRSALPGLFEFFFLLTTLKVLTLLTHHHHEKAPGALCWTHLPLWCRLFFFFFQTVVYKAVAWKPKKSYLVFFDWNLFRKVF